MTLFNPKPISLRTLLSIMGWLVVAVTTLSVPAGFFYVEYSDAENILTFKAQLKANRLAKYIYNNDVLWQYQTVRLAEMIEVPEAEVTGAQRRIIDAAGKLVLEIGAAPAFPAITRSAPIVVRNMEVGRVEISASARPLAVDLAIVLALSCLLGVGIRFGVRAFPLRILTGTLQEQNFKFDAALNNMSQGLIMIDASERLVVCNDEFIKMYGLSRDIVKPGCSREDMLRHRFELGHLPGDFDEYFANLKIKLAERKPINFISRTGDGREISITGRPMDNGGWVVTYTDISERRAAEAKIAHMALHDTLTNLPNRRLFHEQMAEHLAHLARGHKFAVLCLDLDGFKSVNDTHGHSFGDKVLQQVAGRMNECLREGDTLARLGGDEFAIIQGSGNQPHDATALAARLIEAAGVPFDIDGHQVVIGVSIGIAVAPADAADADQLLKSADMALYRAKAKGRGTYSFFELEMDRLLQARRALELDLRKALVNGEFELYYQPLINLERNEISGFEALIRWNHPKRGMISPLEFIGVAEETALIVPIGEWVLRQACAEAMTWPDHLSIAVNLSPAQFQMRNLTQMVMHALAQAGLPARRLELEITESVMLVDSEATLATLHQLRKLGVRISMDDFGTGYSSLSYLRSFPFDKIKIDRSFVHELHSNADSKAIIQAVTGIGSSLGIMTTGEGVETQEELDYLKRTGCTEAQGYFFSKPQPAREIAKMLAKHQVAAKAVA